MTRGKRIGFVIDSYVPTLSECLKGRTSPRGLLFGATLNTSIALMRFRWIAEEINKRDDLPLQYELYRPWRKYDAVIFLKSMGEASSQLARRLKAKGIPTVFDSNVDYFTPASGEFYYDGMAPTKDQCSHAIEMAEICDAIIGDSRHITNIASSYNENARWIPDNVRDVLIVDKPHNENIDTGKRKLLFWSGEAVKLFELLLIKDVLESYSDHFHLILVTNSLKALDQWNWNLKIEFLKLLNLLSHEFMEFHSIDHLINIYDRGGIVISPRYLNNTYNMGHTEWKITLGMARGCIAMCSPQPSYKDVYQYSTGRGIRICEDDGAWGRAFDDIMNASFEWEKEQNSASRVVKDYYSTSVVAESHAQFVGSIIDI